LLLLLSNLLPFWYSSTSFIAACGLQNGESKMRLSCSKPPSLSVVAMLCCAMLCYAILFLFLTLVKSSYIKQLKPPTEYPQLLQSMYDNTVNHTTKRYDPQYRCLRPRDMSPNHIGLGRYALERWAFSHPDVTPCDILRPRKDFTDEEYIMGNWTPPGVRRAPRLSPTAIGLWSYKTSFARLEGRLFEWNYVYGMAPRNSSWVWNWYRGDFLRGTPGSLEICQNRSLDGTPFF
jgi:hypothetical protein